MEIEELRMMTRNEDKKKWLQENLEKIGEIEEFREYDPYLNAPCPTCLIVWFKQGGKICLNNNYYEAWVAMGRPMEK